MAETRTENTIRFPSKWQFSAVIPFALLYTAFIILGNLERASELGALQNIGRILLCLCVSYALLLGLCFGVSNRRALLAKIPFLPELPAQRKRQGRRYVFALFFLICLSCYLPFFLMYYPTWFNNDAIWQMEQILGMAPRSNHHPYFHTMIIRFFYRIGYRLSGTIAGGLAFYTFWQMAVMAFVFAFILYQLYKRGTRLLWLFLALLFYAALPFNAVLTICMGKDEFFAAALLFYTWMTAEYAAGGQEMSGKSGRLYGLAYFAAGLLVCLLRSNGVFVFIGTTVILFISDCFQKKLTKDAAGRKYLCAALVFVCYLLYHGPILRALQVEPPDTIEGLAMPAQHLACAYLKGGELTEEEKAMIEEVVPTDRLEEVYNPYLFDPVKALIREEGNQQAIEEQKWEYFKLWFKAGLRNPLQYMVAEVRQTMGYWAYRVRDYQYVYVEYFMVDNPFGVTTERKFFTYDDSLAMGEYLMGFQDFFNRVWSLGLNTWLMLFGLACAVYEKRNPMPYVPSLMLIGTLLLAAPVYNEFRYIYGMFITLPFLFSYSFGDREDGMPLREGDGR
ncbi:MAG: DUF6020 family protein [Blautia sp.]|nr:DUF6020 family protein [Blautia sp.]MCM1200900.1 DUF6020 family protein [Bacteroides fragilis]